MPIGQTLSPEDFKKRYGVPSAKQVLSADEFRQKYNYTEPISDPATPKKSFFQKLANAATGTGRFLGVEKFGQGVSTLFDKNTQQTVSDVNQQEADSQQSLINAMQKETDPVKKQRLADTLKNLYGVDYKATTSGDLNAGYDLSNREFLGSALNVATTVVGSASLPGKVPIGNKILGTGLSKGAPVAKSVLGKTVEGAVLGYASDVGQKANANQDGVFKPGFGTVTGAALPIVTKALGSLVKSTLGQTTGVKKTVIDRAVKNPTEVNNAIREFSDEGSKQRLVVKVKNAFSDYLAGRNKEFGDTLSTMTAKAPISKDVVSKSFAKEVNSFGGQIKNGSLTFGDTALSNAEQSHLKNVWKVVKSWKDVTPQGLDTLRQRIGSEMDNFSIANNGRNSVVLGNIKKSLTNALKTNIDGYGQALSTYSEKTRLVKDLAKELNTSNNAKSSTQLNSVMKLFKKDPSVIENLTKIMGEDEANKLLNEVAGATLSDWLPSGMTRQIIEGNLTLAGLYGLVTGGISIPAFVGGIASTSPKVAGQGAVLTGQAIKKGVGTAIRRASTIGASKAN